LSRILSVDYGAKRCGIAVTDVLKISINPLSVVPPGELLDYISKYMKSEEVETLAIGWPRHSDGNETYLTKQITTFLSKFAKLFPNVKIEKVDESFSSIEAKSLIFQSGAKKKKRREKALVDQISAVLILKRYLEGL